MDLTAQEEDRQLMSLRREKESDCDPFWWKKKKNEQGKEIREGL